MSQVFSLVLNSGVATNRSGPSVGLYSYNINWANVIPDKYRNRKFLVGWSFRSQMTVTALVSTCLINAEFGTSYVLDQSGNRSPLLGALTPRQYTSATVLYGYASDENTNQIMTDYPTLTNVAVTITDGGGAQIAALPGYILVLFFTLIDDCNDE